jgi:hypothetical protein
MSMELVVDSAGGRRRTILRAASRALVRQQAPGLLQLRRARLVQVGPPSIMKTFALHLTCMGSVSGSATYQRT